MMKPNLVPLASAVDQAAHEVAQAAIEMGERVATLDTTGSCVTLDLYALSLNAAKRHLVHPVRALTAAIDLLWGVRDFVRGPKVTHHPAYCPWIEGKPQW